MIWPDSTRRKLYTDLRRLPAGAFAGRNVYTMGKASWPERRLPGAVEWYREKAANKELVFVPRFDITKQVDAALFAEMTVLFQYTAPRAPAGPELLRDGRLGPNTLERIRWVMRQENRLQPGMPSTPAAWAALQLADVAELPGVPKLSRTGRPIGPGAQDPDLPGQDARGATGFGIAMLAAVAALFFFMKGR